MDYVLCTGELIACILMTFVGVGMIAWCINFTQSLNHTIAMNERKEKQEVLKRYKEQMNVIIVTPPILYDRYEIVEV